MAIAILLAVLVLVGAGLVIAVRTAQAARRDLENLEGEFADSRGGLKLDSDSDPAPWTPVDLEILRDDVIVVEGVDPFDTLTEMISPAAWQASQEANGSEHTAAVAWDDSEDSDDLDDAAASWLASRDSNGSEHEHELDTWFASDESETSEHELDSWLASQESNGADRTTASWLPSQESNGADHTAASWVASQESNGSDHTSSTDLAPVEDMAPVAWHSSGDAPVIILVVGVGFLGTGMTAGVTTADRLRQAWGQVESSFSQARVITLDPDARHAATSVFEDDDTHDGIVVDDEHDPFPQREENGDSQVRWPPPRPNGLGPRSNGDPKPIEWRAPSDYASRR